MNLPEHGQNSGRNMYEEYYINNVRYFYTCIRIYWFPYRTQQYPEVRTFGHFGFYIASKFIS